MIATACSLPDICFSLCETDSSRRPWQFLQLREESAAPPSVDKEFAMFRAMERERTDSMMRRAKTLKVVAFFVVLAVIVIFAIGMFAWMKTRGQAAP